MHLLTLCLLVWAWATASGSAALLVVVGVQRVARVLMGWRPARPLVVPYPESSSAPSRARASSCTAGGEHAVRAPLRARTASPLPRGAAQGAAASQVAR